MDGSVALKDSVIGIGHQQPVPPRYNRLVLCAGLRKDRLLPCTIDVLEYRDSAGCLMGRRIAGRRGRRASLLLLRGKSIGYAAVPRPGVDRMDIPVGAVEINRIPWLRRISAGVKPRYAERGNALASRFIGCRYYTIDAANRYGCE